MTIKTLSVLLILALSLVACQNDAPQSGATQDETTQTGTTPMPAEPGATLETGSDAGIQPATPDVQAATPPPAAAQATKGSGKTNPAHGQPGHRCDIAVGASLDGPATKPAMSVGTTPSQKPVTMPAPLPAATAKPAASPAGTAATTAPGTNPAHGQPGHRCDISVGAPLDSKPKQ